MEDKVSVKQMMSFFEKSSDVVFREIKINDQLRVYLAFVDGLVNSAELSEFVLRPLVVNQRLVGATNNQQLIDEIRSGAIYFPSIKETCVQDDAITDLLMGSALIIIDDQQLAFLFDLKGFDKRGITEPTEELALKGSKEAFVEAIRINTSIIRRKLRTPDLVIEDLIIGNVSKTTVCVFYLKGLVDDKIVAETLKRLNNIDVDQVLYTSVIEEKIIDYKYTPFPQIEYTEKPSKFSSALLEGRIGIIIDGIPFTMIIPTSVVNFFQTTDDYEYNYIIISVLRLMRYGLALLALILPAFYVAVTSLHIQMIPEKLVLAIIESEQGVPLPIYLECFILLFAFQVLIEAGARIWNSIGGMVSLVGALIVGEAAISANYISPGVLVVVATASIANYTIPNKDFAFSIWLWSFLFLMLTSIIGLFGIVVGVILFVHHLSQIEILGEPYLMPFVSNDGKNLSDSLIKSKNVFEKKKTINEQT